MEPMSVDPGGVWTKTCRRAWTSTLLPREGRRRQAPTGSRGVPHRACTVPKLVTNPVTWGFLDTRDQAMITCCAVPTAVSDLCHRVQPAQPARCDGNPAPLAWH